MKKSLCSSFSILHYWHSIYILQRKALIGGDNELVTDTNNWSGHQIPVIVLYFKSDLMTKWTMWPQLTYCWRAREKLSVNSVSFYIDVSSPHKICRIWFCVQLTSDVISARAVWLHCVTRGLSRTNHCAVPLGASDSIPERGHCQWLTMKLKEIRHDQWNFLFNF